jgi:outer membrane protein OmpA-like peptidoglycan-associated protein
MVRSALPLLCCVALAACAPLQPAPKESATPSTPTAGIHSPDAAGHESQAERNRVSEALRALDGRGIEIRPRPDGALLLRLPAAEGFARNRTEPAPPLLAVLQRIAPALSSIQHNTIHVIGHTDSVGSEMHNLQLSIRRAEAVVEALRALGVPIIRLSADGHGENEPIADNASAEGRALNRRVEILVRTAK